MSRPDTEFQADAAGHDPNELHVHPLPIPILVGVFAVLMVLTALTVGITTVDFGYTANLLVALGIAVVKGTLVGLYFMHLRYDAPFNGLILVAALLFVTLFIGFALMDTAEYNENYTPPAIPQIAPTP